MKLEQSFEVAAPVERVWDALIDVEHVAPCLPGAAVTGRNDDGSYSGTFTLKIGPTTASYTGKLEMEQADESSRTATMQANGTDKRGQGGAKATIVSKLSETSGGTRVDVVTDYHITGRLARFGRSGMIEDISERLLREFAQRLQASLTTPEPAAAASSNGAESADGGGADAVGADAGTVGAAADAVGADAGTVGAGTDAVGADAGTVGAGTDAVGAGAGTVGAGADAVGAGAGTPVGEAEAERAEAQAVTGADAGPTGPPIGSHEAQPLEALPLVMGVLRDRIRANPLPVAALLGFLLAVILRRRARS
jgi:uncharacterized protein